MQAKNCEMIFNHTVIKKNKFLRVGKACIYISYARKFSRVERVIGTLPFLFFISIQIPVYDLIPRREEGGGQTHREFLSSPAAGRSFAGAL